MNTRHSLECYVEHEDGLRKVMWTCKCGFICCNEEDMIEHIKR